MRIKTVTLAAFLAAICMFTLGSYCFADTETYAEDENIAVSEEMTEEADAAVSEEMRGEDISSQEEIPAEYTDEFSEATVKTNYDGLEEAKKIKSVRLTKTKYEYPQINPASYVEIILNNGKKLDVSCYSITKPTGEKVGTYKLTVSFRGAYQGYPSKVLQYTVIPSLPTAIRFASGDTPNRLTGAGFCVTTRYDMSPVTIYLKYSTRKDMAGSKVKAFKPAKQYNLTGLAKNTQYYIAAYYSCKGNDGKTYYSFSCAPLPFRTAADAYVMPTLANSKAMYATLKKGKKFTLSKRVDGANAKAYTNGLWNLYPYFKPGTATGYSVSYKREDSGVVSQITFFPVNSSLAAATQKKIDAIVKQAKKKKTNVKRVEYVNKRIKAMCSYSGKGKYPHSAYSCLVQGKAVCEGYAQSFAWCMNEMDITNRYAYSKSGDHVWNQVYLTKKKTKRWWNVDVTWNDTTKSNKYLLTKTHKQ